MSLQELELWWPLLDRLAAGSADYASVRHARYGWNVCGACFRICFSTVEMGLEWQAIQQSLDTWQQKAADCSLHLDVAVVIQVLEEALSADGGRFGHRSGALTVSAGADAGHSPPGDRADGPGRRVVPRHQERAVHLVELQRRLGDPSSTDQDRYVLLEALMSARQHLLISWNSRDERRGDALPLVHPVQQWLSLLEERLNQAMEELKIEPPANPLDAGNFQATATTAAISRDRRLLDARRNLEVQLQVNPSGPAWGWRCLAMATSGDQGQGCAQAEAIETSTLAARTSSDWLKRQGIEAGEWCDAVDDLSPLSMDELNRHQLIRERLAEQLDQLADHPDTRWEQLDHVDWRARCCGQG